MSQYWTIGSAVSASSVWVVLSWFGEGDGSAVVRVRKVVRMRSAKRRVVLEWVRMEVRKGSGKGAKVPVERERKCMIVLAEGR